MIVGIVQARMGSSRFPGKTLMEIEGKPMLWHVVDRLRRVESINKVVIATTVKDEDSVIVRFALENGITFFRGDADDVLDRFYRAALENKADTVVRVTSDCPLCSPDIIEKVMRVHLEGGYDYTTNTLIYSYPEGTDVEVFSFGALEQAWKETGEKYFREHVTPYLRDERKFRIKNVLSDMPVDVNKNKWSVDTMDDLIFVREVFKRLYAGGKVFTAGDVLDLLREKPGISGKRKTQVINEGYYKSFIHSGDVQPRKTNISMSQKLCGKVAGLIPGMSQTFSKGPTQFVQGVAPVFAEKASGCRIWDVDNNEFIDYSMALGAVILGHAYPRVENDVIETIRKGTTFTLPHRLEGELAGLISETVPSAEMVRFGKNGSDATSGAVRAARAYTGKDKIACSGYHGWQDWFIGTTTRNDGVPKAVRELTFPFEYNKIETLEKIFRDNKGEIACVIMEPAGIREPEKGFLEAVKDLAHSNGALLIFDEIVTGFRYALGGAEELYGVIPDLTCLGKAMGNGYPISAVAGRKEVMAIFDKIFFSFTFGGEIVSISAAISVIRELREKGVLMHIWEQGRKLRDGYNVLAGEFGLRASTECVGPAPRTVISFKNKAGEEDLVLKSLFQQECIKRGVLFSGGHNMSFSHTGRDIDYTLSVYKTVLGVIKKAIDGDNAAGLLEGQPISPVFRKP